MDRKASVIRLPLSPKVRTRQHGTRRRVLSESARLFVIKGYENVSVEDIISSAGIARSSFYRFFANREDVLSSIIRPLFELGLGNLQMLATEQRPPRAIVTGILDTYLSLWRQTPDGLRLSTRAGGVHFELFRDLHKPFRESIDALLQQVAPSGVLRNGSASYSGRLIARTAIPVMEIYHQDPRFHVLYHQTMAGLLLHPE